MDNVEMDYVRGMMPQLKMINEGEEEETFDIVFSKDSLIHVEHKSSIYREICRVLRPGGVFAASDWLRSEDADELAGYRAWRISSSHDFAMQTLAQTLSEMADAGLVDLRSRDRSEWYCKTAAETVKMMRETGWREQFIRSFGRALYEQKLAHRQANARAATCGGLRPTHIFGSKPDQD